MRIVVFGAGSLGSLLGGLLASEHDVTLVGREPHVDAVRTAGLRLEGEYEASASPAATTDGTDLEADLAVVSVKAFDTESVATDLVTGTFDAVLSVQNGMGNEETLAEHLEIPVLSGTATYGAIRPEPGVVECTGRGTITLGPRVGGRSDRADRVGEAFERAGFETTVATDMPTRLWTKLAVNSGINPVTALTETRNGAILEPPANAIARAAARETARVARETGVSLSDERALERLESVADATAANTSSMAQDIRVGRRTEIDAINGYVLDVATENGLEVPTNRILTALVRTREREQERTRTES